MTTRVRAFSSNQAAIDDRRRCVGCGVEIEEAAARSRVRASSMRHSIVAVLLTFAPESFAQAEDLVAAVPAAAEERFLDRLRMTIGLGVFGDAYPVSTVSPPGGSGWQRSLMGGLRFWLGTRLPGRVALRGILEIGYATVGPFPGRGSDGMIEGAGGELAFDGFENLKPFIRFIYDAVVIHLSSSDIATSDGILLNNGFFVHLGARYGFVELHLAVGRDLAGGVAPGLGFSAYWLH